MPADRYDDAMSSDPNHALQQHARALGDPSRFQIFDHIRAAHQPVPVADLTDLLGFNHNAIRQHLAVLVESGLVAEFTEHRTTRGRPRKLYVLRDDAMNVFAALSGSYEQLAGLLLELAGSTASPYEVGRAAGRNGVRVPERTLEQSALADHLEQQLRTSGFEPRRTSATTMELGHCPFADLAQRNQAIVCELHRGLLDGHLDALSPELHALLEPRDPSTAGCLVELRSTSAT